MQLSTCVVMQRQRIRFSQNVQLIGFVFRQEAVGRQRKVKRALVRRAGTTAIAAASREERRQAAGRHRAPRHLDEVSAVDVLACVHDHELMTQWVGNEFIDP
ncbi:MAG: hypothetical protein K2Y02_02580 [Burkholderiaceae bacterium]|nr:hypothetical protein [Burkholderiaceae bacterium]